MRYTDHFHPALLAMTAALLATAALDARPARPTVPSEFRGRPAPCAAPVKHAEANDLDTRRACRPWAHQPDCETRFKP
jgi:hypothetical protein